MKINNKYFEKNGQLKPSLSATDWAKATGEKATIGKYINPKFLKYCRESEASFNGNVTVTEKKTGKKESNTSRKDLLLATYPECVLGFNRKYHLLPSDNHKLAQKELCCLSNGTTYSGQKAPVTGEATVVQQKTAKGKNETVSRKVLKDTFLSADLITKGDILREFQEIYQESVRSKLGN